MTILNLIDNDDNSIYLINLQELVDIANKKDIPLNEIEIEAGFINDVYLKITYEKKETEEEIQEKIAYGLMNNIRTKNAQRIGLEQEILSLKLTKITIDEYQKHMRRIKWLEEDLKTINLEMDECEWKLKKYAESTVCTIKNI